MTKYRILLLFKSGLKKEEKNKLISDVKKWLGEIKNEKLDELGEKKLAYPIKKQQLADYVLINFEADKLLEDLNKKLLIEERILRYLLVKN